MSWLKKVPDDLPILERSTTCVVCTARKATNTTSDGDQMCDGCFATAQARGLD